MQDSPLDATASNIEIFNDEKEVPNWIDVPGFEDCDCAVNLYGDSMMPLYRPGDIIVLKKVADKTLILYGEVYLVITNEYRTVKVIRKAKREGIVLLVPLNDHYDIVEVSQDAIIDLFHVKGRITKNSL